MSASRDEFPKAFAAGKLTEYQYEKFTPRIWTPIFSLFGITPKPGSFLLQYYCLIVEYSCVWLLSSFNIQYHIFRVGAYTELCSPYTETGADIVLRMPFLQCPEGILVDSIGNPAYRPYLPVMGMASKLKKEPPCQVLTRGRKS